MEKIQVKANCHYLNEEGKGIVEYERQKLAVANFLPTETGQIEVSRHRGRVFANLMSVEKKSMDRVKPKCPVFSSCGGCQLQHMNYMAQLRYKKHLLQSALGRVNVNDIEGMEQPYNYRYKIQAAFKISKKGRVVTGIFEENSHVLTPIDECCIQNSVANKILISIGEIMTKQHILPYDEDLDEGTMRYVLIRTGYVSKQVMVVLVCGSHIFPGRNNFVQELRKRHPEISTIVMNVNSRQTSVILGDQTRVLYGRGFIQDTLCDVRFQISPKSFYQVNPPQTQKLYQKAIELADIQPNDKILDTYCGIGTITLIASKYATKVIGVESNPEAIKDAIENARLNQIKNAYFINDDAGEFMMRAAREMESFDVVIMDPPRSGCSDQFLLALSTLKPKKIIYISCNPTTLGRDIQILSQAGYEREDVHGFDLFPQTYHVESVIKLVIKEK